MFYVWLDNRTTLVGCLLLLQIQLWSIFLLKVFILLDRVYLVLLETLDNLVKMENLVYLERQDPQVHLENVVKGDSLVKEDFKDQWDLQDQEGKLDRQDKMEQEYVVLLIIF